MNENTMYDEEIGEEIDEERIESVRFITRGNTENESLFSPNCKRAFRAVMLIALGLALGFAFGFLYWNIVCKQM
jgi:hypothetical protein